MALFFAFFSGILCSLLCCSLFSTVLVENLSNVILLCLDDLKTTTTTTKKQNKNSGLKRWMDLFVTLEVRIQVMECYREIESITKNYISVYNSNK